MKDKRTIKVIFTLVLLVAICFIVFGARKEYTTDIMIRNNSNESIKNLIVCSNDGEDYKIECIEPHAAITFKYSLGNFNENALNMRHVINADRTEKYNILGYIDQPYEWISIDIDSVDVYSNLSVRVETP
ncbi:hypothetical protein [Fusibacter ferrireducens]|uniref:Uncharacterized protein n=1 Tax=Fusibacter ferrireducens TaxID=2785058 RepID=A0ABR9ZSL5_9FIRM|nr:hypothetical protein [Fusibacter ferrireducens]MBF4693123.1 hypothetical protein [Fusibacter ferrireducens]